LHLLLKRNKSINLDKAPQNFHFFISTSTSKTPFLAKKRKFSHFFSFCPQEIAVSKIALTIYSTNNYSS